MLLLDDDAPFRAALERVLRNRGLVVEAHASLESFLNAVRAHRHDVLLIDWNLWTILGTDVCSDLRAEGETRPIVLISGAIELELGRRQAEGAGASDFIQKTASADEWQLRIIQLVRGPANRAPTRSGVHRLDPGVHAASLELRDGDVVFGAYRVTVRPQEYRLLEHLLAHAGTVVSSDALIVALWSEPVARSPEAVALQRARVTTTMNRLRDALGASSGVVETVRGGYRVRTADAPADAK